MVTKSVSAPHRQRISWKMKSAITLAESEVVAWPSVTFGFRRNPDVAGNGGSGGRKRVRPIAIDYRTVAGTAGAEYKETEDRRGQTVGVRNGLQRPYRDTRAGRLREETRRAEIGRK